jgi:hypothetical protein
MVSALDVWIMLLPSVGALEHGMIKQLAAPLDWHSAAIGAVVSSIPGAEGAPRSCAFRKSFPNVMVVQARQDWDSYNDPGPLHCPT